MSDSTKSKKPKNYLWLDLLKGIAMIAVVIDHLFYYYNNLFVQTHTGFHVSLFILLAGFTSAISIQNRGGVVNFSYILKRISKIFLPYLIATLIYCLYFQYFDLATIFRKIYTFSVAGPTYFVFFYIQLVSISSFIYKLINHQKSNFFDIPLVLLFFLLSLLFNRYKIINSFYGGSGVLFGGSFFFLYTLGFFIKKYEHFLDKKIFNYLLLSISLISFVIFEYFNLISKSWSNPANNLLIIYCLIVFSLFSSLYQLVFTHFPKILKPITLVGQQSLYVFLYHTLIINIFSKFLPFPKSYSLLATFYLLILATYLPILISSLAKRLNFQRTKALKF